MKRILMALAAIFFIFMLYLPPTTTAQESIYLSLEEFEYATGETITLYANISSATVTNITFEIDDPSGIPVLIFTNQTDENGRTAITFSIGDDADIGDYTIYASGNVSGDGVSNEITLPVRYPSPLTLASSDITFSKLNPSKDETIQIYAVIHNDGGIDASGIVKFYDGDINATNQINGAQTIFVPAMDTKVAKVNWTPATDGNHTIFVSVESGEDNKTVVASINITVGGDTQPILVLTTGDINVYRFEPNEERTISVDVTSYLTTVNNVHLVVLDDQNLTIDATITPPRTMSDGDTIQFYLRIKAPELIEGKTAEYDVIIQAVGDGAYSNAESLDVVVAESAISFFSPTILVTVAAAGAGFGAAGYAISRREPWKYALFTSLLVPLYVKRKEKVLDHFVRGQIYGQIRTKPGTYYTEIRKTLGVANGQLTYHLETLIQEGYIKFKNDGKLKRFYPTDMKMPTDKEGIKFSDIQLDIIDTIRQNPGITQSDIGRNLGKDRQTVAYHIKQLAKRDVIRLEKDGRESHCYVAEDD